MTEKKSGASSTEKSYYHAPKRASGGAVQKRLHGHNKTKSTQRNTKNQSNLRLADKLASMRKLGLLTDPRTAQVQVLHDKLPKKQGGGNKNRGKKGRSDRKPFQFDPPTSPYGAITTQTQKDLIASVPPLADGDLRVVPVCGVEWVGTNMTFVEYKDEIVVIDAGVIFSNPNLPGINYRIPDISYLKANKHKIKGLVITHGHLDHIGSIPFVLDDLGNPPVYTFEFGSYVIQNRLSEFPELKNVDIRVVDRATGYIHLSDNFQVKFFGLTHSIPDSSGVIIQTPLGGIVSTGDVRVENKNGVPVPKEVEQYEFFKDENILLCTIDSTGIPKPGWSQSEEIVHDTLDRIIKSVTGGRLFVATFASQVERLMSFIESARKHGKYIAIDGRSMKANLAIVKQLELIDLSHVISIKEVDKYPDNKVVCLITGAQGERYAALNRMARGEHRDFKLKPTDTIVLSSSVIPGNHFPIAQMLNKLYRITSNIITYADDTVHASGHGKRDELLWIHSQIPYKFFMPVHGEHHMLKMHAQLAREMGVANENIVVPDNGSIIEIRENGTKMVKLDQKANVSTVIVDGAYRGPLQEVVMRDRLHLMEEGMLVAVVTIDIKKRSLKKSPDIISRGFVYLRGSRDLINKIRGVIKKATENYLKKNKHIDFDDLKKHIGEKTSKFIKQKTSKDPIVVPVILGI